MPSPNAIDGLIIKQACFDLVARYAKAINDADLEAFVDLFAPNAVWQRPCSAPLRGRAEIRAFMAEQLVERVIRHVSGVPLVEVVDARRARGWSHTTVYQRRGTGAVPVAGTAPEMVVDYRDEYLLVGERWRFARRETTIVFVDPSAAAHSHRIFDEPPG